MASISSTVGEQEGQLPAPSPLPWYDERWGRSELASLLPRGRDDARIVWLLSKQVNCTLSRVRWWS